MNLTILGGGQVAEQCRLLLRWAGTRVEDHRDARPSQAVVLGDVANLFGQALRLLEARAHVLVAEPNGLTSGQIGALIEARAPGQALFFWAPRRNHPGYRLMSGLIRSDESGWAPRHLRHVFLTTASSGSASLRKDAMESLAIVHTVLPGEPRTAAALRPPGPAGAGPDFMSVDLEVGRARAVIEIGVGEAVESRRTLVAAASRKACIDEADAGAPMTITSDAPGVGPRRLVHPHTGDRELAWLQCLAFLDATAEPWRCEAEAALWSRVVSTWRAIESSLAAGGERVRVFHGDAADPIPVPFRRPRPVLLRVAS